MNLKVTHFQAWDEGVFTSFIDLKQSLQGHLPTFFPESLEDYQKLLSPSSPFMHDYDWSGVLIEDNHRPVAKAILSRRKGSSIGNLGFIDWVNDMEVAKLLTQTIEELARAKGIREIKTPVDLNFFIKYRIKCQGGGAPYYGEPIYPDYYHELFLNCGYQVIGSWDTYQVKRFSTFTNFLKKRKKLKARQHAHHDDIKIRLIRLNHWEEELRIVHQLFVKSFENMAEFEPITYEQFKLVYNDFKYVIHPLLSYIVELKGTPVGFSINYPDPLEILSRVKGKKLSTPHKLWLLASLKLNFKTLLMPYMGKTTGPNGEEVKGVFIKISKMLSCGVLAANKALVCYQSPDSPSRRPLDPELTTHYAKYVLYGKKLE